MIERMFGVKTKSLIRSLSGMELDMAVLGDKYARNTTMVREDLIPEHLPVEALPDQNGFHDTMAWLGSRSAGVVADTGQTLESEPVTRFGKKLLRDRSIGEVTLFAQGGLCHEMEPRLVRSLGYHTPENMRNQRRDLGAVIFLDEADQPVGYQKSSGEESIYVWHDTTLITNSGPKTVPGDSFAYAAYTGRTYDEWPTKHSGLVALRANRETLVTFGLARASSVSYPPTVRIAMANAAAMAVPKLAQNLQDAISFKPSDVKQRVESIMASGMVPIIG